MTETKRTDSPPSHRPVRQLPAASVGNAVEWYDWYVAALRLGSSLVYLRLPKTAHTELER